MSANSLHLETEFQRLASNLLRRESEYLPGRAHFAALLAERIYHAIVLRDVAQCRATRASLAWRLFFIAGDEKRAEGARMLGASIMGTHFDGGSLDWPQSDPNSVRAVIGLRRCA